MDGGALAAQWVKCWSTDLTVSSASPARGEIFSTVNGFPLRTAFRLDITEILLKTTDVKSQVIRLSIILDRDGLS